MKTQLLSTKAHCINDYALAAGAMILPSLLGVNKKAAAIYGLLGLNLATYTAVTDNSTGVVSGISLDTHKKIDIANLATIYAATLAKPIRKDKKALAFHAGLALFATLNVLLTDWDN